MYINSLYNIETNVTRIFLKKPLPVLDFRHINKRLPFDLIEFFFQLNNHCNFSVSVYFFCCSCSRCGVICNYFPYLEIIEGG